MASTASILAITGAAQAGRRSAWTGIRSAPRSADLAAAMAPVNDQGSVGACTAFAVGDGAMNYEMKRIYGAEGWTFSSSFNRVSPKYLYGVTGVDEGLGCPSDGRYLGS